MDHTEQLTRYTANFIDELVNSGLKHIVISPGSRSTPLAVLAKHHPEVKEWVLADERSAAFFALGVAKETGKPAALICTSGTAAANYYPAIVEASLGRVPLLVLTADRPHELRGVGAPQAINQIHMYGSFVKDFQEMALPEASPAMLDYVRHRAAKVTRLALQDNPGPVHVNFPYREPLMPDLSLDHLWGGSKTAYNSNVKGEKRVPGSALKELMDIMISNKKGLIVCGPQNDEQLALAIVDLAEALQIPVLADPLSQLRTGSHNKSNVIVSYDALFREQKTRQALQPDYILRFGAMPTSKSYRFYAEEHTDALQFVVEHGDDVREPTNHNSHYIFADSVRFCEDILLLIESRTRDTCWLDQWHTMERIAFNVLKHTQNHVLTEGETVRTVCEEIESGHALFIGNSMPVRDLDNFLFPTEKRVKTFGNRGASGIDGVISSALGVAAASEEQVTLIIGDLSFYHDLNGLLAAKHYHLPLRIILINNDGGGIFSFLPQAKETTYFEPLFGTPLDLDFEKVVSMYGGEFTSVTTSKDLKITLQNTNGKDGLHVLEVRTDRSENVKWHNDLWEKLAKEVLINHE